MRPWDWGGVGVDPRFRSHAFIHVSGCGEQASSRRDVILNPPTTLFHNSEHDSPTLPIMLQALASLTGTETGRLERHHVVTSDVSCTKTHQPCRAKCQTSHLRLCVSIDNSGRTSPETDCAKDVVDRGCLKASHFDSNS
eukprot:6332895-Amphidinium_carterae.1